MLIAFHSNQLSYRGTEVALYDYAYYNETILGNKSIVLAKDPEIWNYSHPDIIEKFQDRFPTYFYKDVNEIDKIIDKADLFYAQKSGRIDGITSNKRTVIHAVFQDFQPHGHVYAYISKWLGDKFNCPYVPYIVDLPNTNENLRDYLNIPKNAIVFGRHGGLETFDLEWVHTTIKNVLNKKDVYFIFMGTNKFYEHENIRYLDIQCAPIEKVKFINSCDAMIHARHRGESFGLAIAEFSLRNKPIITWTGGGDQAHLDMLNGNCYLYNDENELYDILLNFKVEDKNWNQYSDFTPINVMDKFKEVFL